MGALRSRFTASTNPSAAWIVMALISLAMTASAQTYTFTKAFAFGETDYTEAVPNAPDNDYVKVVQDGANFLYSSANGYGYTDLTALDNTSNNRNTVSCELYDQFIGAKYGGEIVFRIDVPNGDYRFVIAGGDAKYDRHTTTIRARDGGGADSVTLLENVDHDAGEFFAVGFGSYQPPACNEVTFVANQTSPTLTVTSGYIEFVQFTPTTGADLSLIEVWREQSATMYNLTVSAELNGSTSPSGVISVAQGASTTVAATPDAGYVFDGWSVDAGSPAIDDTTSDSTAVTLNSGDAAIRAHFAQMVYTLNVQSGANGVVAPAGAVSAPHGDSIAISATPDTGYVFAGWSVVSGSAAIADPASASTHAVLTSGDATIQASFALLAYELTVSAATGGSTTPSGTVSAIPGQPVSIAASPNVGFHFTGWTVISGAAAIADTASATTTVTLNSGAASVRASFGVNTYALTVEDDGNGATTPSGTITVNHGAATSLNASPAAGYTFVRWTVVSGSAAIADSTSAATAVTLTDGDATVRAECAAATYTLTVGNDGRGSTTPSGAVTVSHGASTSITATPHAGYLFDRWVVTAGSATIGDTNAASTTVSLHSGDAGIEATFTPMTYALSVQGDGNGSTTPSGTVSVEHGAATSISAAPATGYSFTNWTAVAGSATFANPNASSTTVTLEAGDATVQANFATTAYTLTVSDDGSGATTPAGAVTVAHGASTSITATPDAGYAFDRWIVTAGSANITDIYSPATSVSLLNGDATVEATFTLMSYQLTLSSDPFGTTDPSGTITVSHGDLTAIEAIANTGYVFAAWSVVSGTATIDNPMQAATVVSLESGDAEVRASFVEDAGYRPGSQQLAISGELFDSLGNPVGYPEPDSVDLTVRLCTAPDAGDTVYAESFLTVNDQAAVVDNGALVVRLGTGTTGNDLAAIMDANADLFVEITIEGATPDVLLPRTPLTASPYVLGGAGGATVLHGTGNPNDTGVSAAIGTYYVDDSAGGTWLRVNSGWIALD